MFQRTGTSIWSSDLGDNSHDWKLLVASLRQHCQQSLVVNCYIIFLDLWNSCNNKYLNSYFFMSLKIIILWPFSFLPLPLLPRSFKIPSQVQKILIKITDQAKVLHQNVTSLLWPKTDFSGCNSSLQSISPTSFLKEDPRQSGLYFLFPIDE